MKTVVVELVMFGQAVEYGEVTLAEAAEHLRRKMRPGCYWHLPLWQFNSTGGDPADALDARRHAAYRAVREADLTPSA